MMWPYVAHMACCVRFLPDDKVAEVPEGTMISDAAVKAGVEIRLPCGGRGRCGRCIVLVDNERVLSCQTAVYDGMVVKVPRKDVGKVIAATDRKSKVDELSPISDGYGLAVDIGTTTIAISVLDMSNGDEVYSASGANAQRSRGEDVLARIQYAEEGGTNELRLLVIDSINRLLSGFKDRTKIKSAYIAGNTAMTHLFLGIDPSPIRLPPFEPVVKDAKITGKESMLDIDPSATVICMPSVSSYVGGDITSDIVDSGMDRIDGLSLLIDVGTNGEIALGNQDMLMCCSSSAGPAFEGSQMTSGMIACTGAVDSVRISDGKVEYTVIGNAEPIGICGSGVIDLVAQLFLNGYVDKRGRFTEISGAKDGVFTVVGDVVITESEIENVIMTKAAIYSATRSMVRNLGVEFNDLENIYIAGGFGNFINMDSAIAIGLFPDVDRDKYHYLGNSSLSGAKKALLSHTFRERIYEVFPKMTYVDLSSDPIFFDEYMSAQFLPHTDASLFPSVLKAK